MAEWPGAKGDGEAAFCGRTQVPEPANKIRGYKGVNGIQKSVLRPRHNMVASRRLDFAKQSQFFRIENDDGYDWELASCEFARAKNAVGLFRLFRGLFEQSPRWIEWFYGVKLASFWPLAGRIGVIRGRAYVMQFPLTRPRERQRGRPRPRSRGKPCPPG
jgi:hypothetical protein